MNYMLCIVVSATNDEIKLIRCRHLTAVFFPWFGVFPIFAGYFLVEFLTWLRRLRNKAQYWKNTVGLRAPLI